MVDVLKLKKKKNSLRNHLRRWARFKARGDGGNAPKEVEVESNEYVHNTILIWCAIPARVAVGDKLGDKSSIVAMKYRAKKSYKKGAEGNGHHIRP